MGLPRFRFIVAGLGWLSAAPQLLGTWGGGVPVCTALSLSFREGASFSISWILRSIPLDVTATCDMPVERRKRARALKNRHSREERKRQRRLPRGRGRERGGRCVGGNVNKREMKPRTSGRRRGREGGREEWATRGGRSRIFYFFAERGGNRASRISREGKEVRERLFIYLFILLRTLRARSRYTTYN